MKSLKVTILYLLFFNIFLQFSCKETRKPVKNDLLANNEKIGKIIMMPDSIQVYKPFKTYLLDSNEIANNNLKIYAFLNVSCPTCIDDIKRWDTLLNTITKFKVPIIFICQSKDKFELIKYLCEQGKVKEFPFPFYLDIKEGFS